MTLFFSGANWVFSHDNTQTCCAYKNYHCECYFSFHVQEELGLELKKDRRCAEASAIEPLRDVELTSLKSLYKETQGDHWANNTGWMNGSSPCEWYGIVCNIQEHVIEINLRSNNVTGKFPANSLPGLHKLKSLNLAENNLSGIMADDTCHTTDTNITSSHMTTTTIS